jgi:Lysyl oxidase
MRRRLSIALVLASVPAAGSVPASAAPLPDLEQVAPYKVRVEQRDGHWYLGFATAVRNVGAGALRIRGHGRGSGTMAAEQLSEDGLEVLNPAVGTLRYVTTYGHRHWHYMGFMRYELRGVDVPGVLLDRKQGFCLGDAPFVDGWCARDKPALTGTDVGIAPGGVDTYEPNVEGQEIAIDPATAPSGRYVLSSRIGPTGSIRETRTDNNVASTAIELRWPLTRARELTPIGSCVGAGCAGALPAAPTVPRRMSGSEARRHARRALRRTIGRLPSKVRMRCRASRNRGNVCHVRLRRGRLRFSGSVRVWYVVEGAATRWRYSVNLVRGLHGCRRGGHCTRRIRRSDRPGGTLPARATTSTAGTTPFACRLPA